MQKLIKVLTVIMVLAGCMSQGCMSQIVSLDEMTRSWVGYPIADVKAAVEGRNSYASRIGWKEKTYPLENGNWVYIEPDKLRTFIHWEVNPQGIIVGYAVETVGKGETTKGKDFKGEFKHPSATRR
jgi:hypothetical protein